LKDHPLLVLGAGGHGRVVADAALECGYPSVAFLDDSAERKLPGAFVIVGKIADLESFIEAWPASIAAIGD